MRILILHMRYHPDLTGTAPLVTDLATNLAAMGDDVTVITSMPHYGRKQIASKYRGQDDPPRKNIRRGRMEDIRLRSPQPQGLLSVDQLFELHVYVHCVRRPRQRR